MKKLIVGMLVLTKSLCQTDIENGHSDIGVFLSAENCYNGEPKTSEKIHVEIMKEPPLGGSFFATNRVMKPLTEREILASSHIMIVISTIYNDISATKNDISDVRSFKFCNL